MSPRKCILGGWLLTICLVSIGWSQETDEEPAKPSSKKKPATSSKAKKPSTSKSTKSAKAKREMKARKDHPEPTDKQPELSLDVHDDPVLEDLANQLDELDAQIRKAVSELSEKKAAKGKAAGKEMLEVGEIYADILRMERLASRLSRAGEPLGNDMGFRKSDLLATYNNFFFTYRGLPGVTAQMAALRTALEKESKNREKILPQVEKLCAADKWNEADELLDANLRVLGSFGVYFEPQNLPYASMAVRHKQVDEKLHELIAAAARENATKLQAEQWPQFAELVQQAKEAQTSIRETGTATVESQSLPGPEVIDQLGAKWLKVQIAANRCQALGWALAASKTTDTNNQRLLDEQLKFDSDMRAALVGIIDADAQRASATEAETLYTQYALETAALVALSASNRGFQDAVEGALAKLAAKSERLAADAAAYQLATRDLLRWRERTAQAYARKHKTAYPQAEELLWSVAGTEGEKLGLVKRSRNEHKFGHGLLKATNNFLELASPALLKQKVSVLEIVGPRLAREDSWGSCQGFSFSHLPAKFDCSPATRQLAADLLVTESLPPLSLEAAIALDSAQRGDFVSAGGPIHELGVHAVVPRMTKLTENDWGLVRLAPLPKVSDGFPFDRNLYLRCDVQPDWVQSRYFYWEPQAGSSLSASP